MPYRVAAKPETNAVDAPSRELHVAVVLALAWVAAVARVVCDPTPSAAIIVVLFAPFLIWKCIKKV